MRRVWVSLIVLMSVEIIFSSPPDSGYYVIKAGDKKVGACGYRFFVSGDEFVLTGWTVMKVNAGGGEKVIRFSFNEVLDTGFVWESYSLNLGDSVRINCRRDSTEIQMEIVNAGKPGHDHRDEPTSPTAEEEKTKERSKNKNTVRVNIDGKDVFILDNYIFPLWNIVFRRVKLQQGTVSNLDIFVPQVGKLVQLELGVGHTENLLGHSVWRVNFDAPGMKGIVWVDSATSRVLRIEDENAGYRVEFTDKCPDTTAVKSMDIHLKKPKSEVEGIGEIKDPLRIKYLRAKVDLKLSGRLSLKRAWHRFDVDASDSGIIGEITVDIKEYDGKKSLEIDKLKESIPENIKKFLDVDDDIPVNSPYIQGIALRFDKKNSWKYVILANRWIADNIKHKPNQSDAELAAKTRLGDPLARARLLVAVLRNRGIPARIVGGLYYFGAMWVPHYWVEVWLGKKVGWRPVDPSTGEDRNFSAIHITLFEGIGNIVSGTVEVEKVRGR